MSETTTRTEPVTHWSPEEEWLSACDGGGDGDLITPNPAKVTCPDCKKYPDYPAEGSRP